MSQINHKHWYSPSRSGSATPPYNRAMKQRHHQLPLLFAFGCLLFLGPLVAHAAVGVNERFVYNKSKEDINASGGGGGGGAGAGAGSVEDANDTDTTNVKLLGEYETDPIPMDFYRELNNITDISEFIEKFIDPDSIDPKLGIHENLRRNVERASFVRAKSASCIPEPTVVDLAPINPKNNFFPRCTRVKRCGGCCNTPWMSCQPTKTEIVNYQVYRYCYEHGAKFCGLDIIPVEQHLECKCDCRVKPTDCNAYQTYDECRCHCTNTEARDKCLELEHKDWDENSCRCVCRHPENCTTGSYYDENQCKCLLISSIGSVDGSEVN